MSLQPQLRAIDRRRATQAMTAFAYNDVDALTQVFKDTNADDQGPQGLILALLQFADWLTRNTGDLTIPTWGDDTDPRDDTP